ncbi:dynamin family protein [Coccidioides immitis RS]|uniref:Dynamin family protein n=1 Tax=Coccidioides immitis (strain RS) TaxID=246410 RepID=J3KIX4_COCIM|nr:dynamin family protein [Coccidioides immitis RS]EAS35952.3 dynamin family protein [Coccidioides immitis RS]
MELPSSNLALRESTPHTVREDSPGLEATNKSIDIMSQSMKVMVKKIQDLRHIGVENSGLPLPKIVVVGDQSTGKSSLIEGISEIKVPRNAGCCTRCPMEINLSESDTPWTCRVLLMKKYIYLPKKSAPTSRNPLGPWIEQEPEEFLFDTLTDKSMLRDVLMWAQLATLNPGRSYKEFMREENHETETYLQVKFSPNVVRLDISAPKFPNLSFYDLPGIINVAEVDEEKYLVPLVENLAKEYIKADNTIVLLTMPMTDDATNSSAARIIREVRGARDRTLGVLTKPDRIDAGYEQWQELLSGEKFLLGHEYFVVKNNSDPMVDHSQAREEEQIFFAHPPWAAEFAKYSDRFGTRKLQAALSSLLLKQIQSSLPRIIDQINSRARLVEKGLSALPAPPSANVPYILCQKLNVFTNNVQAHMNGGSSEHPFLKEWSKLASAFQEYLVRSRPTLKIVENIEIKLPGNVSSTPEDDNDLCEITEWKTPSKRKLAKGGEPDLAKKLKASSPPERLPASAGAPDGYFEKYFGGLPAPIRSFTPQQIRDINADTYASGIPGLGNPQAVETMNRLSVAHWLDPMRTFLSETYNMVSCVLMQELDNVFGQYRQTALYPALKAVIFEFLEAIRGEHYRQADENYNIECSKPFTLATEAFSKVQDEALEMLSRKRFLLRRREYLAQLEAIGKACNPNTITQADLGTDSFMKEIEIAAASRAYYDVAGSRFVDVTCQGTYTKLFFRCRNELRNVIEQNLGILGENASERCMELMAEDEERQRRRVQLRKEKEKLDKAQEWLRVAEKNAGTLGISEGPLSTFT